MTDDKQAQIDKLKIKGYDMHQQVIKADHAIQVLQQQYAQNQQAIIQLESKQKENDG